MVYQVVAFTKRKAGVTLQEYKDDLENKHIPLFKEITGDEFPLSHTRHYLTQDDAGNTATLLGNADPSTFDAMAVAIYEDKAHWERVVAILRSPENRSRMQGSADTMDGSKTFIVEVGEVCETKK